ncbi:MAG: right-handed parallel beta-helix repeat-containing protein, partial [Myxococcota bacterium]|nr:right-handed parallel beta-helix repeat-containing protein [Myxococcota bacterium]
MLPRFLATLLILACLPATALAATTINGGNIINQTWTSAGSPYIVRGDIIIPDGAFLSIQAGVEVQFANSDSMSSGFDTARTELTVLGTLTVNGTQPSPVRFRAQSGTASGIWYGLVVADGAIDVSLQHASIEHAVQAIRYGSSGSVLDTEAVEIGTASQRGVWVTAGSPVINGLNIHNVHTGILVDASASAEIKHTSVYSTSSYGIFITAGAASGSSSIEFCSIHGPGLDGIQYNGTQSGTGALAVIATIVSSAGRYGVYRNNYGTINLSYSNVWGSGNTNLLNVASGSGNQSANPLFVSSSNLRLTANSPCRFASETGTDIGALPYISDPTPGLYGTLWSNTVLDLSGSPYTLAGDLTVGPGVTLSIQPGVELRFAVSSDLMRSGHDTARGELRNRGNLRIEGSRSQPVKVNTSSSSNGSWYGLVLVEGSAYIRHADLGYAVQGLRIDTAIAQDLRFVSAHHCSQRGVWFTQGNHSLDGISSFNNHTGQLVDASAAVQLSNGLFYANSSYGVFITAANG